jgi:hypothetical protein
VVSALAIIVGSTGLIQLSRSVDLLYIYWGIGSLTLFIGLFLIFGIRDVIALKKKQALLRKSGL